MNRAGRMATETLLRFFAADRSTQRIFERRWHCRLMSDCEVQLSDLFEVTDPCFVEDVVAPEEIGLAHVTLSKTVKDGRRDALRAVTDGIDNRLPLPRKLVRIRSVLEFQWPLRVDDTAVRRDLEGLAHRCSQLRRLRLVTLDARF